MIVSNCFLFFCSLVRPALPPRGPPVALFPSPHFHPGEGEGRILRQFWQVKVPKALGPFPLAPVAPGLGVNSSSSSARACAKRTGGCGDQPRSCWWQ